MSKLFLTLAWRLWVVGGSCLRQVIKSRPGAQSFGLSHGVLENGKIPNHKDQMTNKCQIPTFNDRNKCITATQIITIVSNIWILVIGYCLGFVICILWFASDFRFIRTRDRIGVRCQCASGLKSGQFDRKETDERRTSNIERPTSNNEFCQFKKYWTTWRYPAEFDSAELVSGCGL